MSATKDFYHDEICEGIAFDTAFFDCTSEKESLYSKVIASIDCSCLKISQLVQILDKYGVSMHNFHQSIMNLPIDELHSLLNDIDKYCPEEDFDNFDHEDLPI